jgi:hypothetical protein
MFDFKNASKADLQKEYNRIATEMGDDQFFTKKELHYLPEIVREGEQVLAFTSGVMDGNTWLITLTDRRIIFLDKGMIYGLKQTVVDLDRVNAVSGETGLFFGKITITDSAKDRTITNVWKKTVKSFTNRVQEAIEAKKPGDQRMTGGDAAPDRVGQLERLAQLKAQGILSEEEFLVEKQRILGS